VKGDRRTEKEGRRSKKEGGRKKGEGNREEESRRRKMSPQMLCSSESICIRGQTGQSVSLSKRFLKGPGDSWEHWLEDVGLSWEQELGVGCTETPRNALVLPRKLDWGDARLSLY
jgi:hypothetical protein